MKKIDWGSILYIVFIGLFLYLQTPGKWDNVSSRLREIKENLQHEHSIIRTVMAIRSLPETHETDIY